MAESLQSEGYDAVIPYLWAGESRMRGSAAKQGPRLARRVSAAIAQCLQASRSICTSSGTARAPWVNSLAIRQLAKADPCRTPAT